MIKVGYTIVHLHVELSEIVLSLLAGYKQVVRRLEHEAIASVGIR